MESIPRKSYYLATKVGRTPDCTFDYSKENTLTSVENSLKKLKVDYIDVIQVRNELKTMQNSIANYEFCSLIRSTTANLQII